MRIFSQHFVSTSIGAAKTCDGPRQRNGYRAQRNAENIGDLAVRQAFGSQNQAALVLLGQDSQHGEQSLTPLVDRQLFFWTRGRIRLVFGDDVASRRALAVQSIPSALLQSQVM